MRSFSASHRPHNYDSTTPNLLLTKDTRVIFQGFTGRQATANARESLAWGTQIVGGTKPGFTGEHAQLGLPVLPSVRKAVEQLRPHATGIYVPAQQAAGAIEEAIEAEVPLIVAVAEHIPLHDLLRIHAMLATQSKSRLVGANSPGIISATAHCRIGFQPLESYMPGPVGVAAKSGTLSYEAVTSLTEAGVGQSLCIGIGGDVIAGTDFVDALQVFEHDDETQAIALIGEAGGTAEIEAAEWIKAYHKRVSSPKPIAALVGGVRAVPGKVMGHAGAWAGPGEPSASEKWTALKNAGVKMVDHPGRFGRVMSLLLSKQSSKLSYAGAPGGSRKRSYHTLRRPIEQKVLFRLNITQHRSMHLSAADATTTLKDYGIIITPGSGRGHKIYVTVARTQRSPCLTLIPVGSDRQSLQIPFSYTEGPSASNIQTAADHLGLPVQNLEGLVSGLWKLFLDKEAVSLAVSISKDGTVSSPDLTFDDAAMRSAGRHPGFHQLHDSAGDHASEIAGLKHGIVYLPVHLGPPPYIGTLVNGAGLAMNTIDSLADKGLSVSNFLDTGGKATAATVKESLRLVLGDAQVGVVFVNIFGGLTKCDMIGEGVLDAMDELKPDVPVVVRLRGTREKEAEMVMARVKKGVKVYCEPDFEQAVDLVQKLLVGTGPSVDEWLNR